jgi:hypothetical protein
MRGIIKASATVFIVLSAVVLLITILTAAFGMQESVQVGLTIFVVGFVSAASFVLVGGACYLLASIDARLERLEARGASV